MRTCTQCGIEKPADKFYNWRRENKLLRILSICRKCDNWNKYHNPKRQAYLKMVNQLRHARQRRPNGFSLTTEWLRNKMKAGKCEATGLPFDNSKKMFKATIDRIDNSKGYEIDNCRVVCWGYNSLKGTGIEADALKLAIGIVKMELERRKSKS